MFHAEASEEERNIATDSQYYCKGMELSPGNGAWPWEPELKDYGQSGKHHVLEAS